jgi:long-chain acyl-CoA synthetase
VRSIRGHLYGGNQVTQQTLILDRVYEHEARRANQVYLTQPVGRGEVVNYTWAQVLDEACRMAAHLKAQGLEPGARVAILSKNCAHFLMAELAIWMAGGTTVAIFPTESAETVRFILEHSEASLLFVGKLDTWPAQEPGVDPALPRIAFPLAPQTDFDTWDAIIARTPPIEGRPAREPDDLAMLIYTSGSTGRPKGVMLSFAAMSVTADNIHQYLRQTVGPDVDIRILSYLPLAHSMERAWVGAASLSSGEAHIYFAESLDTFVEDLRRARPTLFISVPRLWLKFQLGVFSKIPPKKLDFLLRVPVLGRKVGKKVLTGLGLEEVRLAGSGSAPLPADLIRWYRRLGLQLLEGYGMTEDNSYSHISTAQYNEPGYVGVPLPGVEAKLSDEGEILIKSPGQFSGYFKQPELTAESFTEDGFFRTGDLGEQRPDGLLKITGRVKELFKTAKGKYVAPVPIENRLNAHPMVEMAIVSGVGQPAPFGLVVLAEHLHDKLDEPAVRAQVEVGMTGLLREVNATLPDYQQLGMLVVAREPWSIENGCLTPTMKLKRARIEASVEGQVPSWYDEKRPVIWV